MLDFTCVKRRCRIDQQVEDLADDWLRITATVVDSAMLHWWLRGFGAAVQAGAA